MTSQPRDLAAEVQGIDLSAEHDRIRRDHEQWYHENRMYDVPQFEWQTHQVSIHRLLEHIAALRRPVVQSEQVEAIRDRDSTMTSEEIRASKSSQLYADRRYLLSALDEAQRELAALKSPPEELAEIAKVSIYTVSKEHGKWYVTDCDGEQSELEQGDEYCDSIAIQRIETLLSDLTRLRNAHQDRVAMLAFVQGELVKRNTECVEFRERRERLEGAIRWALGEVGEFPEEPQPLAGKYRQRYYWRTGLRERAGLAASDGNAVDESKCLAIHAVTGRQEYERCEQYPHCHCGGPQESVTGDVAADRRKQKCARCADTGRRWDAGGDMTECECRYSATGDGVEGE